MYNCQPPKATTPIWHLHPACEPLLAGGDGGAARQQQGHNAANDNTYRPSPMPPSPTTDNNNNNGNTNTTPATPTPIANTNTNTTPHHTDTTTTHSPAVQAPDTGGTHGNPFIFTPSAPPCPTQQLSWSTQNWKSPMAVPPENTSPLPSSPPSASQSPSS